MLQKTADNTGLMIAVVVILAIVLLGILAVYAEQPTGYGDGSAMTPLEEGFVTSSAFSISSSTPS